MTQAKIDPALVQLGDKVVINKEVWALSSLQGPDSHGTYDAYLINQTGMKHEVITDAITIIV
jgi:hypothetical protein